MDLTNSNHLAWLRESIIKHDDEFRNNIYALNEFIGNLREGKEVIFEKRKPGEVWQTQSGWAGLKPGEKSAVYGMKSKETAQSYVSGQGVDKEVKERNSNSNVSSIDIDAMDGEAKKGGMEKKVKAPGNDTSTVNEIGVGYAMACMDESPEDVKGCLDGKLNDSKLGLKTSTPKRELIIQSARAERKRVDDYIKNPENGFSEDTKVSHVWGSKESLSSTVDKLGDQGVKEINGIPFDPNAELYDIKFCW